MKNWFRLLASAISNKPDKIPIGWKTASQIAKEAGVGESTVRRKLRTLHERGLVERKDFRLLSATGKLIANTHWKPKGFTPPKAP